ncbi:MAG: SDR family oxidoreductase [Candidatus Omnitrophica bacterium]|nr:SDR family oxidoreductase [Candidatus Omnitrophota bacterium]
MKKFLITGSNGFLAQKLAAHLRGRKDIQVLMCSRGANRYPLYEGHRYASLDICDRTQTKALASEYRPDVIINTAAISHPDLCEINKEECWKVNVEGVTNLIHACLLNQTHLIHLSSDFVFDGDAGPYAEEDLPHPVNIYGKSKHASEELLKMSPIPWTILRNCLSYGILQNMPRPNLVIRLVEELKRGKTVPVTYDQFRTPTLIEDLAEACIDVAIRQVTGLYHIAGGELVSVLDFARKIAEVFDLDPSWIRPITTAALKKPAQRPLRGGLKIEKAQEELGYCPHFLDQGLKFVRKQYEEMNATYRK